MQASKHAFRILPAVIWSLLVVVLLATPGDEIPDPGVWDWLDKPAHALLFGIHYGLLVRALRGSQPEERQPVAAVLGSGIFAALMETAQLWIPGRGWEWWDLVANFAGITVAALLIAGRRARLRGAS